MSSAVQLTQPENNHVVNIDSFKSGKGVINLALRNNVVVNFSRQDTLQTIYDQIKEKSVTETESLQFFTTEGALVPLNEKIGDLSLLPIIMQMNKSRTFAVNFQNDFCIEEFDMNDTQNPEFLYEFSKAIGLKNHEKYLFPCFLQKVQQSLPRGRHFSHTELSNSINEVMLYMQNTVDDEHKNLSGLGMNDICKRIVELEAISSKNAQELDVIAKQAQRKARALMWMGSSVLMAELGYIVAGTFHFASWDIMEPISYLMMYGNFLAGFTFYLGNKKDLDVDSLTEVLASRFRRSGARSAGIDLEKQEAMVEEIHTLRAAIKNYQN